MAGILRPAALALLASAGLSTGAFACPICLAAMPVSPADQLDLAAQVVVLDASADGSGWSRATGIKGGLPVDLDALGHALPPDHPPQDGLVELALRDGADREWVGLGHLQAAHVAWLEQFLAGSGAPWQERLARAAPMLGCGDPVVEELAYAEMTRAPYPELIAFAATQDQAAVIARIEAETDAAQRAADILLLGGAGGDRAATAAWIDARLDGARASGDAADLAALVASDLQLNGQERIDAVADSFLLAKDTSVAGIEATLLAFKVQGDADLAVPRARIVEAYRRFIAARPAMAGFVAADLRDWQDWSAVDDYRSLLAAGRIHDPAGEFAAVSYVQAAEDAAGQRVLGQ